MRQVKLLSGYHTDKFAVFQGRLTSYNFYIATICLTVGIDNHAFCMKTRRSVQTTAVSGEDIQVSKLLEL